MRSEEERSHYKESNKRESSQEKYSSYSRKFEEEKEKTKPGKREKGSPDKDRREYQTNKTIDVLPDLYSIHRGRIQNITDFGAFVLLEDYKRTGLVHISQVTKTRLSGRKEIEEIVAEGESVWVKVIAISEDSSKMSLSMKLINQTDGRDLDPNNVDLLYNQQKKRPFAEEQKPILINAVLDTVCTRCGGSGHVAFECYSSTNSKYDLVPVEVEQQQPTNLNLMPQISIEGSIHSVKEALEILEKHRHYQKEKKSKKNKKHKREDKTELEPKRHSKKEQKTQKGR